MIILREYNKEEVDQIINILKEEVSDYDLDGIVYVVIEDSKVVGVSKVKKVDDRWLLDYLIIKKANRNNGLGDSLLRAILNKIYNMNAARIYYQNNDSYLIKKGFELTNNNELELNIEEFFAIGCGNCGELDVI